MLKGLGLVWESRVAGQPQRPGQSPSASPRTARQIRGRDTVTPYATDTPGPRSVPQYPVERWPRSQRPVPVAANLEEGARGGRVESGRSPRGRWGRIASGRRPRRDSSLTGKALKARADDQKCLDPMPAASQVSPVEPWKDDPWCHEHLESLQKARSVQGHGQGGRVWSLELCSNPLSRRPCGVSEDAERGLEILARHVLSLVICFEASV